MPSRRMAGRFARAIGVPLPLPAPLAMARLSPAGPAMSVVRARTIPPIEHRNDEAAMSDPAIAGTVKLGAVPQIGTIRSRWPMVLGGLLTVAMVAGIGHELLASGLGGLSRMVPESPLFYLAFALLYLSPPTFDYVIFRRLWAIPVDGLIALLKKRIANDAVFGYSGDAYFYAWARQRTQMVSAPFGAVKDSSILSAMAGNAITLLMVVIAFPVGWPLLDPAQRHTVLW